MGHRKAAYSFNHCNVQPIGSSGLQLCGGMAAARGWLCQRTWRVGARAVFWFSDLTSRPPDNARSVVPAARISSVWSPCCASAVSAKHMEPFAISCSCMPAQQPAWRCACMQWMQHIIQAHQGVCGEGDGGAGATGLAGCSALQPPPHARKTPAPCLSVPPQGDKPARVRASARLCCSAASSLRAHFRRGPLFSVPEIVVVARLLAHEKTHTTPTTFLSR
jgi:hypothetical protein